MITVLPEPKRLIDTEGFSTKFTTIYIDTDDVRLLEIAKKRFWNYPDIFNETASRPLQIELVASLEPIEVENQELFREQGYSLVITEDRVTFAL